MSFDGRHQGFFRCQYSGLFIRVYFAPCRPAQFSPSRRLARYIRLSCHLAHLIRLSCHLHLGRLALRHPLRDRQRHHRAVDLCLDRAGTLSALSKKPRPTPSSTHLPRRSPPLPLSRPNSSAPAGTANATSDTSCCAAYLQRRTGQCHYFGQASVSHHPRRLQKSN